VEIRIGISQSGREIVFDSDMSTEEIEKTISEQVANGEGGLLRLEDSKGHVYIVPTRTLAYVELTKENPRKVGFAP
jgi:hypothetical protein